MNGESFYLALHKEYFSAILKGPERKIDAKMITFLHAYRLLLNHYGPQHWWPADSPFEVTVGAFLTQNTNWSNVEKAIANLRQAEALSCAAILGTAPAELEQLIRPAGFFRQKAERLKLFCRHLGNRYQGNLDAMLRQPTADLRRELLSLKGIGPETADSILLYAGQHLSFVVDAYTNRLFQRLGALTGDETYDRVRALFMDRLPQDVATYNEYHALIVIHCKQFCKKTPQCDNCPCLDNCNFASDQRFR